MILTSILVIVIYIYLLMQRRNKIFIMSILIIGILCVIAQASTLSDMGLYTVGSDANFYFENGKDISLGIRSFGEVLGSIDKQYCLYTIFNAIGHIPYISDHISMIIISLNYVLIAVLFIIKIIRVLEKNELQLDKRRKIIIYIISVCLFWLSVQNFRDGFIAIIISSVFLVMLEPCKRITKLIKMSFLLILLNYFRSAIVPIIIFSIASIYLLRKSNRIGQKVIIISAVFVLVLAFIPSISSIVSDIKGISLLKQWITGSLVAVLVDNPIKFFLYLIFPIAKEGSITITSIVWILSIFIGVGIYSILYPYVMSVIIIDNDYYKSNKIKMVVYSSILLMILTYGVYSIQYGVQMRIKLSAIIPVFMSILFLGNLSKVQNKLYGYTIVVSYIFFIIEIFTKLYI